MTTPNDKIIAELKEWFKNQKILQHGAIERMTQGQILGEVKKALKQKDRECQEKIEKERFIPPSSSFFDALK